MVGSLEVHERGDVELFFDPQARSTRLIERAPHFR